MDSIRENRTERGKSNCFWSAKKFSGSLWVSVVDANSRGQKVHCNSTGWTSELLWQQNSLVTLLLFLRLALAEYRNTLTLSLSLSDFQYIVLLLRLSAKVHCMCVCCPLLVYKCPSVCTSLKKCRSNNTNTIAHHRHSVRYDLPLPFASADTIDSILWLWSAHTNTIGPRRQSCASSASENGKQPGQPRGGRLKQN